jgi:hypothetical protein
VKKIRTKNGHLVVVQYLFRLKTAPPVGLGKQNMAPKVAGILNNCCTLLYFITPSNYHQKQTEI